MNETVMKWIPCKERMPETRGKYLVCYKEIKRGEASLRVVIGWYEDEIHKFGAISNLALAWMPVPEPYREEDEE